VLSPVTSVALLLVRKRNPLAYVSYDLNNVWIFPAHTSPSVYSCFFVEI
jgi:hypothetical protein